MSSSVPEPADQTMKGAVPAKHSFASGRYVVRRVLPEGGQKTVYVVHDTALERDCALALIRPGLLEADDLERFRREARAMARLDHPNIVAVHEVSEEDGRPFFVCQYITGGDLRSALREAGGALPVERALTIAEDLCRALAHAHEHGIVHRDVKPANVLLTGEGTAKLGDFGLAAAADRSRLTLAGTFVGTAAYMAPEQALGQPADARSDLYALGCVLYELLTGRPPFLGDDALAVISQHVNTAPIAPSWHNPDAPKPLEALVLRLLAKAPGERPASATAVLEELRRIAAAEVEVVAGTAPAEPRRDLAGVEWGRFVGRQEEMDQLKGALEQALSGKGALAMLVGEPGIGKTRLAEEFAVYAELRGARVLTGHAYEGEASVPYRPFVEALRQYVRARLDDELRRQMGPGAPEVATLVSEVRRRFPEIEEAPRLEPEAERLRLFDSVSEFLRSAAHDQPLLLVLDDLHWADKPSLLLLQHLARSSVGDRLLIVGAYRDVDLDRQHPLADALATLRGLPNYRRLLLRGLPLETISDLLNAIDPAEEGMAGRAALAQALHQETEGNPFFIREVLAHLIETGKIVREDGRWLGKVTSISELGIPEGVREVIRRRLSRLSEGCGRVLSRASAMTAGFSWDELKAISGEDEGVLLDSLDEAIASQLISERKEQGAGRYDFTHALIRHTLYEELSTPRRVLLHRQIGEALELLYGSSIEPHLSELAHHFYRAAPGGDVEKAIAYCRKAGDTAQQLVAWEDAARHYERALLALDLTSVPDDTLRCSLLLATGEAYMRAADPDRGRPALRQAVELAERIGAMEELASAALAFGTDLLSAEIGRTDDVAIDALERALAALPSADSEIRAHVLSRLALELAFSTKRDTAELLSQEAVEMARRVGSPRSLASATIAAQWVAATPEKAQELIELADGLLRVGEETGDVELLYTTGRARLVLLLQLGRREEIEDQLERCAQLGEIKHSRGNAWATCEARAMLSCTAGDFADAERLTQQALAIGLAAKEASALPAFAVQLLALRQHQGRLGEVEPSVRTLGPQFDALDVADVTVAWIRASEGRAREETQATFETIAGRGFKTLAHDQLWLIRIAMLAEICAFLGDEERAAELYELILPYAECMVTVEVIVCLGSASRFAGKLASTLKRWPEAEAQFRVALAMNQRMGRPLAVWTQRDYADMLLRRSEPGDRERALALLQTTLDAAQEMGMKQAVQDCLALKEGAQGINDADTYTSIDAVARRVGEERPDLGPHASPDGTVTIMFSDVEDSTVLTERLGDQVWQELLRKHNTLIREQLRAYGGYEVKTMGGGFMVAFQSAKKGLDCAIAIQRAFDGHTAADGEHVKVRIGLHAGEAIKDGDDFYGKSVIMASRVAGKAVGGEILVSSLLRQLLESNVGAAMFGEPREVELKGLAGAHTVYAIALT